MRPVYLLITAHTPRHLGRTLMGVAAQSRRPDGIVLSCDNDSPDLSAAAEEFADRLGLAMLLVQRPFTGAAHCGQVRNNAVRALQRMTEPPAPDSLLVCLDQDCIPSPDFIRAHERLSRSGDPILGFRIDLTASQTDALQDEAILAGREFAVVTEEQRRAQTRRHRRLSGQALLRRLGLGKAHKPKILGANFAVSLAAFLKVNGFDEAYRGYGQEDDDFVRRLYAVGYRPAIGVRETIVYHQYHPTRAPDDWERGPNADRFAAGGPARCVHGVYSPLGQGDITIREIGRGGRTRGSADRERASEQSNDHPLQPTGGRRGC